MPSVAQSPHGPNAAHENRPSHYSLEAINASCARASDTMPPMCASPLELLTVECITPPLATIPSEPRVAAVSVSLNAQNFAESRAGFRFYPAPRVSAVHPTLGPRTGGTLITVRSRHLLDHRIGESMRTCTHARAARARRARA